jgi:hypothetical protein
LKQTEKMRGGKGMSKKIMAVFSLGMGLFFFGCAHEPSTLQSQLVQKDNEIKQLESTNKQQGAALAEYEKKLEQQTKAAGAAEMKARQAQEAAGKKQTPSDAMLLPPNAKPGQCYARVFIPPTYKTVTETVLKRGASEDIDIIPAKYEWVEEQVLVSAASQKLETVPAQYEWVEEKVLVKQASSRKEEIPAKYEWQEEKVLVKPAETVWKKGRGPIEKVENATGEIMCLVEIPAVYETVKKKVMVSPPSTREIAIPAQYETVKKRVMVKPPTTRTIEIPAAYKTVKVQKMVSPPQEKKIPIPAEYQSVTKTQQVTDGRMEWREILCETNVSTDFVRRFQTALSKAGHDPGPIDGVIGWQTEAAMKAYQKQKGLAEGALTYETVKSLGLAPR